MGAGDWGSWEEQTRNLESRGAQGEVSHRREGRGKGGVVLQGVQPTAYEEPSPFVSLFSHQFFSPLHIQSKDLHFSY